jgi:hypothetical protein
MTTLINQIILKDKYGALRKNQISIIIDNLNNFKVKLIYQKNF